MGVETGYPHLARAQIHGRRPGNVESAAAALAILHLERELRSCFVSDLEVHAVPLSTHLRRYYLGAAVSANDLRHVCEWGGGPGSVAVSERALAACRDGDNQESRGPPGQDLHALFDDGRR
jgi:hypothetical protein